MKNINVYERAVSIGKYVVKTGATVRQAAKEFEVSKSTVHKDITKRLEMESPILKQEVEKVLIKNKNERHLRGGEATRKKYLEKKLSI